MYTIIIGPQRTLIATRDRLEAVIRFMGARLDGWRIVRGEKQIGRVENATRPMLRLVRAA